MAMDPAERQAEQDYLTASLTGRDDVEHLAAATEARRLEEKFGLGQPDTSYGADDYGSGSY